MLREGTEKFRTKNELLGGGGRKAATPNMGSPLAERRSMPGGKQNWDEREPNHEIRYMQ